MRPRSARFDSAMMTSHQVAIRVDAWIGTEPTIADLQVVGGDVALDRRAVQRGRLRLRLAEPTHIPGINDNSLSPFGPELRVSRGIVYADDTTELIPLGVFPIEAASVDDTDLVTSIDAFDRSQRIRDARFEDVYTITAGTNYGSAIQAMITAAVPGTEFAFASTAYTTPLLVFEPQADRWEAAVGMARSIGMSLYYDGLGVLVMQQESTLAAATPSMTVSEGEGGALIDASLAYGRAEVYNRVVATGENASLGAVYRGVATDLDPASPTYYNGPFGHKPRFYASPLIASTAQATSAATAILSANLGLSAGISLQSLVNPALEPGDGIFVERQALGIDQLHIVDALRIGLAAESSMSIESRYRLAA